jgi:hypothetical protein
LFKEPDDLVVESFVNSIANDHLQIVGTELIPGKIYQRIGFPDSGCPNYFKSLVQCRLVYPGSKLKLSQKNIDVLRSNKYEYSLGGRIKNETNEVRSQIVALKIDQGKPTELKTSKGRIVVSNSNKRAHNDKKNIQKGLKRLEKKIQTSKLTKEHINNPGYNKYLKIVGEACISIDYNK